MLKIVVGELIKLETLPGPLLVDNMGNDASTVYGSFPDRLYILLDGRVVYQVTLYPPTSIILNLFFFYRVVWDLMDMCQHILILGFCNSVKNLNKVKVLLDA